MSIDKETFLSFIREFPEAVILLRAGDEVVIEVNELFVKLTGYRRTNIIDRVVSSLEIWSEPDLWPGVFDQFSTRANGRDCFDSTIRMADGQTAYVMISIRLITAVDEPCYMVMVQDITHHKQVEDDLQKALASVQELKIHLETVNTYIQEESKTEYDFGEIIGRSDKITKILRQVEQVANTPTTVLILGETGTGKELIARAIHAISDRNIRPLVKVNCAALPANLIESELFGYEKGAFTGASFRKIGRFELANAGTILLDEIGDLPIDLQAKLLRILQEGEFERLGGIQTIPVDVRVIAITNRDLEHSIRNGSFREDLYHRLNVFPINVPPLREHKDDIPFLANHFLKKYVRKFGQKFEEIPKDMMDLLMAYDWPGNVRELGNIVERSVITSQGNNTLSLWEWPPLKIRIIEPTSISTLQEVEKLHIQRILLSTKGRVSGDRGAAKILGMNPKTLGSKMRKLQIKPLRDNPDIKEIL
jgi:formate hydrogenlyase transcriptional activator